MPRLVLSCWVSLWPVLVQASLLGDYLAGVGGNILIGLGASPSRGSSLAWTKTGHSENQQDKTSVALKTRWETSACTNGGKQPPPFSLPHGRPNQDLPLQTNTLIKTKKQHHQTDPSQAAQSKRRPERKIRRCQGQPRFSARYRRMLPTRVHNPLRLR